MLLNVYRLVTVSTGTQVRVPVALACRLVRVLLRHRFLVPVVHHLFHPAAVAVLVHLVVVFHLRVLQVVLAAQVLVPVRLVSVVVPVVRHRRRAAVWVLSAVAHLPAPVVYLWGQFHLAVLVVVRVVTG